jgi:xylulose-5-phosphate/fructose-6-phosphate phosphoketolase
MPAVRDYHDAAPAPGGSPAETTRVVGGPRRDVVKLISENFRIFGPHKTASNQRDRVFDVTNGVLDAKSNPDDDEPAHSPLDGLATLTGVNNLLGRCAPRAGTP